MTIEGFRAGWRAGVQDTTFGASVEQVVRSGDAQGARGVVENAAGRAGNAIRAGLQRAGAVAAHRAAGFLGAVGANEAANEVRQAGHELQAAGYEGQARNSLQKAGLHFKKAFTAAFRAYEDTDIKGIGANLTFSVASWGANMKESMVNFGCAIADGCRSLVSWFKAWKSS